MCIVHINVHTQGLPSKGVGNGGTGGADRRGGDDGTIQSTFCSPFLLNKFSEFSQNSSNFQNSTLFPGNRRPASVKASLAVAFGQRAPNRKNAIESGSNRQRSDKYEDEDGGWEEGDEGGEGWDRYAYVPVVRTYLICMHACIPYLYISSVSSMQRSTLTLCLQHPHAVFAAKRVSLSS